jgi:hypothetical protein
MGKERGVGTPLKVTREYKYKIIKRNERRESW